MTKFLNISTDTTLGGSSASDSTVSSQKAIKAYVDSQTGTAPAFANITGQPTDNANLASALNAKYDASNPNGYTSNVGTVTSVNNVSPVNGNVTLSIPTVDQTYSASSTNAQSGVALSNAKFLQNTAGNSTSLTVFGNPSNSGTGNAINIGYSSTALNSGDIAMGRGSNARGGVSIALGFDATVTNNCSNAIQLGTGTNSTANTFNVGFRNVNNYLLLDGTTGLIPDARLSSNIARTSAIPTVNNATLTITQGGTTKGTFTANASSDVTIALDAGGGTVDVDNKSITTNSSDEIQTVGVINSRDSSTAIKTWTGTKAQYDAITTKDSATLYNITDDTTITQTILEALYPVGSIYITTANTCPLSTLISGSTWTLRSSGIVTSVNTNVPCKGNGMSLGLTDGTNNAAISLTSNPYLTDNNSYGQNVGSSASGHPLSVGKSLGVTTDSSKSGIVGTVTRSTLAVNIFERTA